MADERVTQPEKPHLHEHETGRLLAPQYETPLDHFPVTTAEWAHVCSARFGPGRPCGWSDTTQWTGDSYRYDIFERLTDGARQMALRWWNGSGEGWLIAENNWRRGEICLLSMIAAMPDEARRWDACHFVWEAATKSAGAAAREMADLYAVAFVEGRLKKRRRNGRIRVMIVPKGAQVRPC
ncbi:MAG: hypothetical protein ACRDZ4_08335 [Egibacteraceae bacterium]